MSDELRAWAGWYVRRRERVLWLVPLTAGLALVTVVLLMRSTMEDPRVNVQKSRAALAALQPKAIPDEENAWVELTQAQRATVAFSGPMDETPYYNTDRDSAYIESQPVQTFWSANAQAIKLFQAAAGQKAFRPPGDFTRKPMPPIPNLLEARNRAGLLALDARCQAHAGNHMAAAKSLRSIRVMARQLETAPYAICQMIALAVSAMSDETFEAILAYDAPRSVEELQAYKEALAQPRDPFEQAARMIQFEGSFGIYTLDGELASKSGFGAGAANPLTMIAYGGERRAYVADMQDMFEALKRRSQPDASVRTPLPVGAGMVFVRLRANYRRSFIAIFSSEEGSILSQTAAAFMQFRVKYGHDAKSLDELVPEFMPRVPHGLFHDQPIRLATDTARCVHNGSMGDNARGPKVGYTKGEPVIRIYTLGPNGQDNGGNNDYSQPQNTDDDTLFLIPPPRERNDGKKP